MDQTYEFQAPKFAELGSSEAVNDDAADQWFEGRTSKGDSLSAPELSASFVEQHMNESFGDAPVEESAADCEMECANSSFSSSENANANAHVLCNADNASNSSGNKRTATDAFGNAEKVRVAKKSKKMSLTVPEPFRFKTDDRMEAKKASSSSVNESEAPKEFVEHAKMVQMFFTSELNNKNNAAAAGSHGMNSTMEKPKLTEPKPFKFASEERTKEKQAAAGDSCERPKEFVESAKLVKAFLSGDKKPFEALEEIKDAPLRVTEPKPFHFASEDRLKDRQHSADGEKPKEFIESAKLVKAFLSGDKKPFESEERKESGPLRVTEPKPFQFASEDRKRPVAYAGREKLEEEELSKMPKFKAIPLNEKVLQSAGDLGVPRVEKRPVTIPLSPKLATELRSARILEREAVDFPKEEKFVFKAQPVSETMLTGASVAAAAAASKSVMPEEKKLTIPKSPELATKSRFENKAKHVTEPEPEFKFRARPVPVFEPFEVVPSNPQLTEPKPFEFKTDERAAAHRKELEEQLKKQQEEEERARHFKARPVPDFQADDEQGENWKPKAVEQRQLTEPKPFRLLSDQRHAEAMHVWHDRVIQETVQEQEAREFHARPIPETHEKPFVPNIESKPVTQVEDIPLATERRALQRKQFDEQVNQTLKQQEDTKKKAELEKMQREQEEVERLRKEAEFHAKPIKHFKPTVVKKSDKALTEPNTPQVMKRSRSIRM
eukprot:ANDGO_01518.mRNA.1 Targeting protein for Xklp2 homolog